MAGKFVLNAKFVEDVRRLFARHMGEPVELSPDEAAAILKAARQQRRVARRANNYGFADSPDYQAELSEIFIVGRLLGLLTERAGPDDGVISFEAGGYRCRYADGVMTSELA